MKMFLVGLLVLLACLSFDANAQFKPSEQQYLSEENLAVNGGFEQGKRNWFNLNGSFSIDSAFKVLGNSSGKIELTAQTLDFSQQLTTGYNTALSGLQGQVSAYIKSNFPFEICPLIDGNEVSCLQGKSDNTFDFYQIPIVLGGTSLGIKIKTSGNQTGTLYIDGVSYGHKQFVQDIAQSELAFDVNIGTATSYSWGSTQTEWQPLTPPDADMVVNKASGDTQIPCQAGVSSSGLVCSGGSESLGVVFDAKAGTYKICTELSAYSFSNSYMTLQLMETENLSYTILQQGGSRVTLGNDSSGGAVTINLCGVFNFETAGKKTIRLMHEKSGTTSVSFLITRDANLGQRDMHIVGTYYPPKSKIVTQLQEETVETANEFSAKVSSTGVVSGENLDWINGNASISDTSLFTITLNTNVFNADPNCNVSIINSGVASDQMAKFRVQPTATTIEVRTSSSSDTTSFSKQAHDFHLTCSKSTDYNKSRMVYGQFEQIKTTELIKIKYHSNDGSAVDANTPYDFITKVEDNYNLWNGNSFTSPRDTSYKIAGLVRISNPASGIVQGVWVNGTLRQYCSDNIAGGIVRLLSCGSVKVNTGDVISIRTNGSETQNTADDENTHHISIMENPDIAGIVKNLNDNRNVKCQTKFLSASTSTTGVLSDLTFSNLTIGKKYKVEFQHAMIWTATGQAVSQISILNGSQICNSLMGGQHNSGNGNFSVGCSKIFTATSTSLTHNLTASIVSTLYGDVSNTGRTNSTLCELPDNYIETTEW